MSRFPDPNRELIEAAIRGWEASLTLGQRVHGLSILTGFIAGRVSGAAGKPRAAQLLYALADEIAAPGGVLGNQP